MSNSPSSTKWRSSAPPIPITAEEAFQRVRPEIDAVPDEALVPISVEIPFAVGIALAAAPRIDTLLPQMLALPYFDPRPVRMLRTYAGAALYAHLVAVTPQPSASTLPALLEEAGRIRADLLLGAETLAHFGLVSRERVAAIRAGSGHLDTANDLVQLSALFGEIWDVARDHTPVIRPMVDRAAELGLKLHAVLGSRRLDDPLAPAPDPRRTRERGFTLLVKAYDACTRAVVYLRWDHGDAELFAPSIYVKRRRGRVVTPPEPPAPASPPSEPSPASNGGAVLG
jgi:hypothetical protein